MEDLAKVKVEFFKEMFKQGENIWVKIIGHSMWPFLKDKQVVMVSAVDIEKISIGDIVLGYIAGNVVCHRVFRRKFGLIQTKADALPKLDPLIGEDELIGKVVAKEVKGRILRIDGRLSHCCGFIISQLTLITARCYPALRLLKKTFLNSTAKALICR
jgi:hypothetical protein